STITDAKVGHDVKSRAANNVITGNVITDTSGTASYEIDLPNGGNAVISNNTIEKGSNAQNPVGISYGEEGNLYASGSLSVTNNLIVSDYSGHTTYAVRNATSQAATVSGNTFYGWSSLVSGSASVQSNTTAASRPTLSTPSSTSSTTPATTPATTPTTTPATPSPVTLGSGSDKIVVNISEDAWKGDAQYTLSVDGTQYGGTLTAAASHAAGQSQAITLLGSFGTTAHTVAVNFLNDAFGGSAATDRNLYVDSIVAGDTFAKNTPLLSSGTQSFVVKAPGTASTATAVTLGSGPDKIVVNLSEDAYQGDAQYTLSVDGKQVGGTQTASASHAAGQSQAVTLLGSFGNGNHTVGVNFLNDAYGGSAATDRNLYVDSIIADGTFAKNAALMSAGTQNFIVGTRSVVTAGTGNSKIVLQMAEDAWQGDAQFTVKVDGTQIGGTLTTTAAHATGATQEFDILGSFAAGSHKVDISFVNDAYGGTASTDRNLYVEQIGSAAVHSTMLSNGTQSFTTVIPS
ncbi:MAG: carbohydrate-binding domain-containing protein, partial [Janthinobacterium lividum]